MNRKADTTPEKPLSALHATALRLRRIKRRWQMLRLGVRVLVVLALLLAGGLLFALFYPLSLPWLDARIKRQWDEAVGLPLDYRRSVIRLARAQVVIEEPVLKDPDTGEMLLSLRRVEANGSLWQLLFGRGPRQIDSLRLEGPTVVRVATRGKHMEVMAPWPRVLDVLEKRMRRAEGGGGPARVAIRQLTVEPVDMRWIDQEERDSRVRLSLEGMALTADFGRQARPQRLMLTGKMAEGPSPARDFSLMVRPDENGGADLMLRLESFFSRDVRAIRLPARFNTGQILVAAHVLRDKSGAWRSDGKVRISNAFVFDTDPPTQLDTVQAEWSGAFDPAGGRVTLDRVALNRPRSQVAAHGWVQARRPWAYDLRLDRLVTDNDELLKLASRVQPLAGYVVAGQPRIEAAGSAAGDSLTTVPRSVAMKAEFSGIDLVPANTTGARTAPPLRAIAGRVEMTTQTLRVERLALRCGGLPLVVDGLATGSLPRSVEGLSLAWRTDGSAAPRGAASAGPAVAGDLNGSGTLRLEEPTRMGIMASLARASLNGAIRFRDVTLSDPWLPAPLSAINGRIDLQPGAARIEKIEGRLGSTALALNAAVTGRGRLWTSPTLTAEARVGGELPTMSEQIQALCRAAGHPLKPLPPLAGTASIEIETKNAPLPNWRARPAQATLRLQDFATTLALERVAGPIVVRGDCDGRLTLRPPSPRGPAADLSAQIALRKGSVHGPNMPPVGGLGGRIAWSGGTGRFEQLSGEALGGRVTLDGTLSGVPGPWAQATADVKVQIATSLENAFAQARRRGFDTRPLGFTDWGGAATLRMNLAGPLGDWRKLPAAGRIDVDDFRTSFTVARVNGPVRIGHLGIALAGRQVRLEPLTGKFGSLELAAAGAFDPWGGAIDASVDGELLEMQRRSPPGLEFFTVGGAGRIEHHQKLLARPGFTPPSSWPELADYLLGLRGAPDAADRLRRDWSWDFDGTLNLRDAELTHWRMPTPLKGISGLAYYHDGRLWSAGSLAVAPGVASRDLRSTLEVTWTDRAREGTLTFGVTGGHFSLDEWIAPWGRGRRPPHRLEHGPPPDVPFDPTLKPFFSIRGTFKTASGQYRGVQCRNVDGALSIDDYHERPNMLRYSLSQASLYGGQADLSGTFYSRRLDAVFETRNVQLRPLVEALTNKQKPAGIFSGNATGRLEIKKDFRFDEQLSGQGEVRIEGSRFVSNAILHGLGGLLKLPLLEDISFSGIHGPITIENERVSSSAMVFDNPIINLKANGSVGFDKTLDMQIQAQVFQIASSVPLVGLAVDVINQLVGKVIRVQVKGTVDKPAITAM